ncbi:MAG: DUF1269 domain-containing protein [Caldilineae bacterium]|nr:DUF1269 domain-containing protein [Anaerolineae bacterium]MCB9155086.1 DUF1269 domain-containing protein [Caldilineae bacterium]
MKNVDPTVVYKVVAFVFADRKRADAINDDPAANETFEAHKVVAHAVVEVDENGKAHFHEAGHAVLGAGLGLVAGGLLGLIGGPAGLLAFAVGGAVIGGIAGQHHGRPVPTEDMERLTAQMQPGNSAYLVLVEESQVESLVDSMAVYEAQVVILSVSDEASGEVQLATALPGESTALMDTSIDEVHQAAPLPGKTT